MNGEKEITEDESRRLEEAYARSQERHRRFVEGGKEKDREEETVDPLQICLRIVAEGKIHTASKELNEAIDQLAKTTVHSRQEILEAVLETHFGKVTSQRLVSNGRSYCAARVSIEAFRREGRFGFPPPKENGC